MSKKFKIKQIDQGYCRVLYTTKNDDNQEFYYCIQEDFENVCVFYRCTRGPYFEPMYEAKIKDGATIEIESPRGDTKLEKAVRNFIESNNQMSDTN